MQQVLHDKEELISQFHVLLRSHNVLLGNPCMSRLIKWIVGNNVWRANKDNIHVPYPTHLPFSTIIINMCGAKSV